MIFLCPFRPTVFMTDFVETGWDTGTYWKPLNDIWDGISGQGIEVHENLRFALFLSI